MSDCPGCGNNILTEDDTLDLSRIEKITSSMEETKAKLNEMVDSVSGLDSSLLKFDNIETQIQQVMDYFESGDFLEQITKMQQMSVHNQPKAPQRGVPSAWIWYDENGVRQSSVSKPEGVLNPTPLYDATTIPHPTNTNTMNEFQNVLDELREMKIQQQAFMESQKNT